MVITRDQMFDTFAGDDNYSGLYNSILNIDGSTPSKDIWITEYDFEPENGKRDTSRMELIRY